MLLIIINNSDKLMTLMTLNDLKPSK